MDESKKKKLEESGWIVGKYAAFLGLNEKEELMVETSLALSKMVKEKRTKLNMTQKKLGDISGKKQPHIARIEKGVSVTFDVLFEVLYAMGVTPEEIGSYLATIKTNGNNSGTSTGKK